MATKSGIILTGKDGVDDIIYGGSGDDVLSGLGGDDRLYGRSGDDMLDGGDGNDRLLGGVGADVLIGGAGNDVYVVEDLDDTIVETSGAAGGIDTVGTAITFSLAGIANVENLSLSGHAAISGTGNALDNVITGNDAANVLSGQDGDDRLDGRGGADRMEGGAGNDTYLVDDPGDQAVETLNAAHGGGIDTVLSSVGFVLGANVENLALKGTSDIDGSGNGLANVIDGNSGANVLSGGAGNDTLNGGAGNDTLDGGTGDDGMSGGRGDDVYIVDHKGDTVVETLDLAHDGGIDTVVSGINYVLGANLDNLTLTGSRDISGTGNELDNVIIGGDGANLLKGGGGNDRMIGDSGDRLYGEAGDDTLVADSVQVRRVDGGDGVDTLNLGAVAGDIDLTGALRSKLNSIEILDLNGADLAQNVILDEAVVASLGGANGAAFGDHTLMVKGDAKDSVTLGDGWTLAGAVTDPFGQAGSYNEFVKGTATLLVETDVTVKSGSGLDLAALDGSNGFRIDGAGYHLLANTVWLAGIGDLNGDGFDDLLLGDPTPPSNPGGATVAFGHVGSFPAVLDVNTLGFPQGFKIDSKAQSFGNAVGAAGDINGDGYADLIVGAPDNQSAYVIFGHGGAFGGFNPVTGFQLGGATGSEAGRSVASAGDVNGDGYDDIIVGAPGAGTAYVLFGHGGAFDPLIDGTTLDGTNGFRVTGTSLSPAAGEQLGYSVAGAGDVNGDGYADLLVAGTNGTAVVFGHGGAFDAVVDAGTLNGTNGFLIDGGRSVSSAGDINGDGIDDVIVGDSGAVVFGHPGAFDPSISPSALNGSNGFAILQAGAVVSAAGDVNGDGIGDLIVAHPLDNGQAGEVYVVFGHGGAAGATLDLTQLTPDQGFKLEGVNPGDLAGAAVAAAGDLNGDGYDDLVIGAVGAQPDGSSYVVFGADFTHTVHAGNVGSAAAETFVGGAGDDILEGNGGKDSLEGGQGNDQISVSDNSFRHVDGGGGDDTLFLLFAGAIDFGDLDGNAATSDRGKISGVETISVDNGAANALTLHLADVLDINPGNHDVGGNPDLDNVLKIDGNAGDTLHLATADGWSAADTGSLAGYAVYTSNGVHVAVDTAIAVTVG